MRHCVFLLLLTLPAAGGAAPRVVATVPPAQAVAAAVTAGVTEPELLFSGGGAPHGAGLRPSMVRALRAAEVVVWVGPALEGGLARTIAALPPSRVVTWTALPGVRLCRLGEGEAEVDPHLWLDPDNAVALASALATRLAGLDPPRAARYRANAARFAVATRALARELERRLRPLHGRGLLVYHDALGYLAARFGLEIVATVAPDPERLPGARHVAGLRRLLRSGAVACVVREPQFPPPLIARLTEGVDVPVVVVDVLGRGGADGYRRLMEGVVEGLEGCLGR